jgi:hypothetical protein
MTELQNNMMSKSEGDSMVEVRAYHLKVYVKSLKIFSLMKLITNDGGTWCRSILDEPSVFAPTGFQHSPDLQVSLRECEIF